MTVGYIKTHQDFTDKQEEEWEKYILRASKIYFGLSPTEIRILALQWAFSQRKKTDALVQTGLLLSSIVIPIYSCLSLQV